MTADRVANLPAEDFEATVESKNPPTVTALAEAGRETRPLVSLEGLVRDIPLHRPKKTLGDGGFPAERHMLRAVSSILFLRGRVGS